MSQFQPIDPHQNPYAAPQVRTGGPPRRGPGANKLKVNLPAIFLMTAAGLGLCASIYNIIHALVADPHIPADAPEFQRKMIEGSVGMTAAVTQTAFLLVNMAIIGGGICMLLRKLRWLGITSSILSMVNIGTCCCVLGLPLGIWSLVILLQPDVAREFDS